MRIERFGVKGTEHNGIFFTEESLSGEPLTHVSVEVSRQNANLVMVKDQMAEKALAAGANAVANFKYGQRAHKWWQHMTFRWDTESWFGEGDAMRM